VRLYLDASALIYVAEGSPERRDFVLAWIDRVEAEPDGVLITSRLSRIECNSYPPPTVLVTPMLREDYAVEALCLSSIMT
jgi:predicted nucleic acid-binding protein